MNSELFRYSCTACSPKPMEPAMINWPDMLRHAEDWADRFCAVAATVLLIVIAGGMTVLFVRGI